MDRISGLSDDLLIKILSCVRTKVAVSTSILSKRWEFLWMWLPKLEYDDDEDITDPDLLVSSVLRYLVSVNKNLLSHRAPIIESLRLRLFFTPVKPEDVKIWVEMAVSRCVRELSIGHLKLSDVGSLSSVYGCKSLVNLELVGRKILVDVPQNVCLPSLKTLQLLYVTYLNEDSLRLLLSYCPVLEDLVIERHGNDNVRELVVIVSSLQRLSLWIVNGCSYRYVIDTPSLKYFKVKDERNNLSYKTRMPKVEEADITVDFMESVKTVKRVSLEVGFKDDEDDEESEYSDGIVFKNLEHLKLRIRSNYWSKLLFRLLNDSPKLRVLSVNFLPHPHQLKDHEPINWSNEGSSIPECLLKTLETFEFSGGKGTTEERDFLSFISKNGRCLKSTSILR